MPRPGCGFGNPETLDDMARIVERQGEKIKGFWPPQGGGGKRGRPPRPLHRSFAQGCGATAPDFPFGALAPGPVLGQPAGWWWQKINGGVRKGPRHLTPGCRLRPVGLRPTLPLSRGLPEKRGKPRASPYGDGTVRQPGNVRRKLQRQEPVYHGEGIKWKCRAVSPK